MRKLHRRRTAMRISITDCIVIVHWTRPRSTESFSEITTFLRVSASIIMAECAQMLWPPGFCIIHCIRGQTVPDGQRCRPNRASKINTHDDGETVWLSLIYCSISITSRIRQLTITPPSTLYFAKKYTALRIISVSSADRRFPSPPLLLLLVYFYR